MLRYGIADAREKDKQRRRVKSYVCSFLSLQDKVGACVRALKLCPWKGAAVEVQKRKPSPRSSTYLSPFFRFSSLPFLFENVVSSAYEQRLRL